MQVANCTTPANYFHILRRQMHRNFRKPLILMTPKSLLRHKRAVSRLDELAEGSTFHRLLYDDAEMLKGQAIKLVAGREDAARRDLLRQGLLRPLRGAREARHRRHLPPARRAALSVPAEGDGRAARRGSRPPRSSGARRSRRTWAPGPSSSRGSTRCSTGIEARRQEACAMPAARPRPRPRPASCRSTCATANQLHRGSARRLIADSDTSETGKRQWRSKSRSRRWANPSRRRRSASGSRSEGDAVARDEPLVELETDKVTIEVPAPAAGRLENIAVKDGETVGVGALLGTLAEGAAGKAAPIKAGPEAPQPRAEPQAGRAGRRRRRRRRRRSGRRASRRDARSRRCRPRRRRAS